MSTINRPMATSSAEYTGSVSFRYGVITSHFSAFASHLYSNPAVSWKAFRPTTSWVRFLYFRNRKMVVVAQPLDEPDLIHIAGMILR